MGFPVPVESRPFTLLPDGIPSDKDCERHGFDKYQFSYASGSAYQRLYKDHDGLRQAFVEYWKLVAETFKDFKNILGADLMNEPWAGSYVLI